MQNIQMVGMPQMAPYPINGAAYAPQQMHMDTPHGPYFNPAVEARYSGQWSDGLCSCLSDIWICLLGACVPCLIYHMFNRMSTQTRMQAKICCCASPFGAACCFMLTACFAPCHVCSIRQAVASRYNIPQGGMCLQALCCLSCMLLQTARHLDRATGFVQN